MDRPDFKIEHELRELGYVSIAGVDEVGRGPGAGPVVAAAVRIPLYIADSLKDNKSINDSKKIAEKKRKAICQDIITFCDVGIGSIDNNIIDEVNILEATKLAMRLAISELDEVDYAIIDGNFTIKELNLLHQPVIKGDAVSISIAAASIVAKVHRDTVMEILHEKYPIYGWKKNKGYLTKEHIAAIQEYGPCEYHRMSFRKVGK